MSKPDFKVDDIPDLTGKVAIVTGASAGIGKESVLQLAKKNCHVILAVRSLSKGEDVAQEIRMQAPESKIEVASLDLADLASVKKFADEFMAKGLPLHILMNNAGE
ncbi:Short-chain dehydrogenase/reductase 2b [Gonapodya sp. JEL0774]|nr:Short-chain dehydrogenase/reductase 2b [Gonapodya sp. JEL0774]